MELHEIKDELRRLVRTTDELQRVCVVAALCVLDASDPRARIADAGIRAATYRGAANACEDAAKSLRRASQEALKS